MNEADNRNAHVVVRPQAATVSLDNWVPCVELLEGDTRLGSDIPAGISLHDEVECVAGG